jgi:hypothetical protein
MALLQTTPFKDSLIQVYLQRLEGCKYHHMVSMNNTERNMGQLPFEIPEECNSARNESFEAHGITVNAGL